MIKNLLDKAKSVIEEIDKNGQSPTASQKKKFEYDDSFLAFNLEGGPIHSDLLVVSAKIKQGENADQPAPLSCKWFVTNTQNEMEEIVGVNGAFYQPCVDDVGRRILVQATPTLLEGNYTGMPVFKEVGPMKLDPEIEKKALKNLEQTICELKVKIDSIFFDYDCKAISLPCDGIITLNKDQKNVSIHYLDNESKKHKLASCKYSDRYPSLDIIRKTNTSFELHLGPIDVLKVSAETNVDRDVIAITVRMFNKQDLQRDSPVKETEEVTESTNNTTPTQQGSQFEDIMRIEQLMKQLKQTDKEKQHLKEVFEMERANRQKMEVEIQELKSQVEMLKGNSESKDEEIGNLQQEVEKISAEKLFFLQEINLYKSQIGELELVVQNLEAHKTSHASENAENRDNLQEKVDDLNKKLANMELDYEQLKKEKDYLNAKVLSNEMEKEELESTINSLKKKVQSLIQENGKLNTNNTAIVDKTTPDKVTAPTSNIWNFPLSPLFVKGTSDQETNNQPTGSTQMEIKEESNSEEMIQMKKKVQSYEEEINQLKEQNKKMNTTLESMKTTQTGTSSTETTPSNKNQKRGLLNFVAGMIPKNTNHSNSQEVEYLHKIVNTLTETIAEKDLMLDNLKKVNKELGKKITEMEGKQRAASEGTL